MEAKFEHDQCTTKVPGDVGGEPSTKDKILETGASLTQDFTPIKSICGHLNAFHAYASDPTRYLETNHYCGHVTSDVRQCILYDRPGPGARILGVEYMISPALYRTLDAAERRLWHSHVFEVKSGMLVMPQPSALVPQAVWDKAEMAEMEQIVEVYGKVYHLWQVDRGDKLPLGEPQLMTSFTSEEQFPDMEKVLDERDARLPGCDWRRKRELRKGIAEPEIHRDADAAWKQKA